jgi:hypothetical protein
MENVAGASWPTEPLLKRDAQITLESFTSFPHEEISSKKVNLSLVDFGLSELRIQLFQKVQCFLHCWGRLGSPLQDVNLVLCRA